MAAIEARRWTVVGCILLAGVLAVAGAAADPAAGTDGKKLMELYAAEPDRVNLKSLSYHFCYTFWMAATIALVGLVRGRGAWLANVAGVLAVLGISTMPGFIVADFVDSTLGSELGVDRGFEISEKIGEFWALPAMVAPGAAGLFFALPIAALAAWRAGLLPWFSPLIVLAGELAFMGFNVTVTGNVLLAVAFAVFAFLVARIPSAVWQTRAPLPAVTADPGSAAGVLPARGA